MMGAHWEQGKKQKIPLPPHPLKKKEPGLFSKEFVTVFGPG
jgi:hypothetical protein